MKLYEALVCFLKIIKECLINLCKQEWIILINDCWWRSIFWMFHS